MKKKIIERDNEINLLELISIISDKKWTVVIFISVFLVFGIIYKTNKDPEEIKATTTIDTISIIEEAQYNALGEAIQKLKPRANYFNDANEKFEKNNNSIIFSKFLSEVDNGGVIKVDIQGNNIKGVLANGNTFSTYSPNYPNLIEKLSEKGVSISAAPLGDKMTFYNTHYSNINFFLQKSYFDVVIDKVILLNIFLETLEEKRHIINIVKKFGLIKKENYLNNEEYEAKVLELASSIKLSSSNSGVKKDPINNTSYATITFRSVDMSEWKNFLKFLESETNLIVKNKVNKIIQNEINNLKLLNKYKFEDFTSYLQSLKTNEIEKDYYEKERYYLLNDRYTERVIKIIETTPILKKDSVFYAGRINVDSIEYQKSSTSLIKFFVLIIILSAILGIFYVIIVNSLKKSISKKSA